MDIKEMNLEQLEERRASLAEEIKTADMERLGAINSELDAIAERQAVIKAEAEKRAQTVAEVLEMPSVEPIIKEERKETKMTEREIRSTQEYIDAYVQYVKNGYDLSKVEKRMPESGGGGEGHPLLITPAGTVAVPTYVEDRIRANWENNELLRRVRKTYVRGNLQVGVEVSSDGAVIHAEGAEAIPTENLTLEFINLIPEYFKKMVKVSHAALDLGPVEFLDYLYDEIENKIMARIEGAIIDKISTLSSPYVQEYTQAGTHATTADLIAAEGLLSGSARPVVLITRAEAAALKAAALEANFAYDPFDGMEVIYIPAGFGAIAIVADLDAVQVNFPNGDVAKFIFDEFTDAPSNIVRIVGRLEAAVGVVEVGKIVRLGLE